MRIKGAAVHDFNKFVTDPGSPVKDVLSPKVLDDGSIRLEKTSEYSLQDFIESFRDKTDMSWIIQQLKAGNPSVLQVEKGMFGDFTHMPKTYADVLQLNINAKKTFESLPLDVKKAYEMDFNKWFADVGSKTWIELMFNPEPNVPGDPVVVAGDPGDLVIEKDNKE